MLGEVDHGDARQVKPAAHNYAPCVHLPQSFRGLAVGTTVVACLAAGNRGQQRARAKRGKKEKRKKGNRKRKERAAKGTMQASHTRYAHGTASKRGEEAERRPVPGSATQPTPAARWPERGLGAEGAGAWLL